MKKFLLSLIMLFCCVLGSNAQNYSNITNDSLTFNKHITLSGKYLKKSAKYDALALTSVFIGGGLIATGAAVKEPDEVKYVCYIAGGCLELAAIFFEIKSISYKWKSGKELEFTGNGIKFTF